jgi:hypothetical protein
LAEGVQDLELLWMSKKTMIKTIKQKTWILLLSRN